MDPWLIGVVVVAAVAGLYLRSLLTGSHELYVEELKRALDERGARLTHVRNPGTLEILRDSPFPKVEVRVGAMTEVNGVHGEQTHQRVCEIATPDGPREIWARLRFEAFRLVDIEFRPDPADNPDGAAG